MAVPLSVSTTCIPVQNMPMGDATKARCPVLRIYIHWFTCASDFTTGLSVRPRKAYFLCDG